ncbi:suppressor of fused domain protein [Paenibacillus xylaniclasticus]|uniref:suppressor of fused domain protein n=1 Tax=Paenibacillus xylaniclasticus TaxID=588083 RepID=UPI001768397F|nr:MULTISPECIES: suppressor of fused domain protein [Paenibacillus]GFN30316.1 hypothetical protein PCURB6_05760 [Paenibacillus curdlanolyticus]
MSNQELSPSGHSIYRHEAREREFQPAYGDEHAAELISQHVEKYIGPIQSVYHEIISDLVHIDIIVVAPTPERNFYTLVTLRHEQFAHDCTARSRSVALC